MMMISVCKTRLQLLGQQDRVEVPGAQGHDYWEPRSCAVPGLCVCAVRVQGGATAVVARTPLAAWVQKQNMARWHFTKSDEERATVLAAAVAARQLHCSLRAWVGDRPSSGGLSDTDEAGTRRVGLTTDMQVPWAPGPHLSPSHSS